MEKIKSLIEQGKLQKALKSFIKHLYKDDSQEEFDWHYDKKAILILGSLSRAKRDLKKKKTLLNRRKIEFAKKEKERLKISVPFLIENFEKGVDLKQNYRENIFRDFDFSHLSILIEGSFDENIHKSSIHMIHLLLSDMEVATTKFIKEEQKVSRFNEGEHAKKKVAANDLQSKITEWLERYEATLKPSNHIEYQYFNPIINKLVDLKRISNSDEVLNEIDRLNVPYDDELRNLESDLKERRNAFLINLHFNYLFEEELFLIKLEIQFAFIALLDKWIQFEVKQTQ